MSSSGQMQDSPKAEQPQMYLVLKKQIIDPAVLPADSTGILIKLWHELERICEITKILPKLPEVPRLSRPNPPTPDGFTFNHSINRHINSGDANIIMLINPATKRPCAVLVFTYNQGEGLYIDYLDGDKLNKEVCGGAATYLLWNFCNCVDNITDHGRTISIKLMDAADRSDFYDILFGLKTDENYRYRTSVNADNKSSTLRRQPSTLQSVATPQVDLKSQFYIDKVMRGRDEVTNLRNYRIVKGWRTFTDENRQSLSCKINLKDRFLKRYAKSSLHDFQDHLTIFNNMLEKDCLQSNYATSRSYFKTTFTNDEKNMITQYIKFYYPPSIWPYDFGISQHEISEDEVLGWKRVASDRTDSVVKALKINAGKIRKTKKGKGRGRNRRSKKLRI